MMKENWVYCRGDIYCANLDPVVGSEQGGIRPVIVIQNDTGNKHAPTLIVATVTTRIHKKANMPTHFVIYDNPAFKEASVVQLEQIRTIDKSRIDNYLGKVTPREMVAIEKALSVSLAMEQLKKRPTKHKAKRTKGSCRLNMSRSPEPLFPLLLKPSTIFWMSICQSMV